ncbi:MAG TPA: hypothetical protein VJU81_14000 [Methylomirabilota bacterium]|nr:hypothetical protein [Methylomirabilota bacterium]
MTRGLLTVQALDGTLLGQGDLTQTAREGRVESRMVLRLHDGSLFDEEVTFTQDRVFSLVRYKLTQRGPAFPESLVASLDGKTGAYEVRARKGEEDSEYSGRLDLPPDIGNGMFIMLVRNLGDRLSASVHTVAWTPKPRIIQVDIVRAGSDQARVAQQTRPARRYELRPKLGVLLSLGAKLTGRKVEPTVCWILDDPVPAFVACEGALGSAQTPWRIGTVSATRGAANAGR